MFEIDGYTGEEIAHAQQVSINTVRARIHRARKKLTTELAKRQVEEGKVSTRKNGQQNHAPRSRIAVSCQVLNRALR